MGDKLSEPGMLRGTTHITVKTRVCRLTSVFFRGQMYSNERKRVLTGIQLKIGYIYSIYKNTVNYIKIRFFFSFSS